MFGRPALLVVTLLSCRATRESADSAPPAAAVASDATMISESSLLQRVARCEIDHRGTLIDLGSAFSTGETSGFTFTSDPALVDVERDGATWVKVNGRQLNLLFASESGGSSTLSLRVRGGGARTATVLLDGRPVGSFHFLRGVVDVLRTHPFAVSPGMHLVSLRFAGMGRTAGDPSAEVDWARLGGTDDEPPNDAPPSAREIRSSHALSGVPHEALALRPPSHVSCLTRIDPATNLHVAFGFAGTGSGEARVDWSPEGRPSVALFKDRLSGNAPFREANLPLPVPLPEVGRLSFQAVSASAGGRVLFGDPKLAREAVARLSVPSWMSAGGEKSGVRLVLLLVLAGIDPERLPPHTEVNPLPAFTDLYQHSVVFTQHRAPTTVAASSFATLLTGLSPREHQLQDSGARLPTGLTTVAAAAREGSIQSAMFTGSPATSAAFGFSAGWDKYVAYSPVEGALATAPLSDAGSWAIDRLRHEGARALIVVHARGGHPPWDVTPTEAAKLPPAEYTGTVEPRRGGEVIARARGKHARFRLTENDRTRMWAIYDAAMAAQDRAVADVVESLRRAHLWERTMVVVTGDVGMNGDARAPFTDGEELSEQNLKLPLWVRFPDDSWAGKQADQPTSSADVSRLLLSAFGLSLPDGFRGADLLDRIVNGPLPGAGPQFATLGNHYSTRWGNWVLSGIAGRSPTLCDVQADPACEVDKLEQHPRLALDLWRSTYDEEALASHARRVGREPATLDGATAAALQVWGE